MTMKTIRHKAPETGLHPENPHHGRYDFSALISVYPTIKGFVGTNPRGDSTIDFADPKAVKVLNQALLCLHYQIDPWNIPDGYLCPPIPGRADYLHHLASLLSRDFQNQVPRGKTVRALDIGTGANGVYPLIGARQFGWKFVATDIDPVSIENVKRIVNANGSLKSQIQCRLQSSPDQIFAGIWNDNEDFDMTLCNPPFHKSLKEAHAGTRRKQANLGQAKNDVGSPVLNFGGQQAELWCPGGEEAFLRKMVKQSRAYRDRCLWFSSLVSKSENVPRMCKFAEQSGVKEVQIIEMSQGSKISRIIAWTFHQPSARRLWAQKRWN